MQRYQSKQTVEAIQFTEVTADEVCRFVGADGVLSGNSIHSDTPVKYVWLPVVKGEDRRYVCQIGEWVVRDQNGGFYAYNDDTFRKLYKLAV